MLAHKHTHTRVRIGTSASVEGKGRGHPHSSGAQQCSSSSSARKGGYANQSDKQARNVYNLHCALDSTSTQHIICSIYNVPERRGGPQEVCARVCVCVVSSAASNKLCIRFLLHGKINGQIKFNTSQRTRGAFACATKKNTKTKLKGRRRWSRSRLASGPAGIYRNVMSNIRRIKFVSSGAKCATSRKTRPDPDAEQNFGKHCSRIYLTPGQES